MVELCELLHPAPEEVDARRAAVAEVSETVQSIWPSASIQVFGSFATGGCRDRVLQGVTSGCVAACTRGARFAMPLQA